MGQQIVYMDHAATSFTKPEVEEPECELPSRRENALTRKGEDVIPART